MKFFFFFLLLLMTVSFDSQKPDAYDSGEWFKFRIHYGFINAGFATLEVKNTNDTAMINFFILLLHKLPENVRLIFKLTILNQHGKYFNLLMSGPGGFDL